MKVSKAIREKVEKEYKKIPVRHVNKWGSGQQFARMVGISEQLASKFIRNPEVTLQTAEKLSMFFVPINPDWDFYFFKEMPQKYRRGFIHLALTKQDQFEDD